jgi:hypothetical protein
MNSCTEAVIALRAADPKQVVLGKERGDACRVLTTLSCGVPDCEIILLCGIHQGSLRDVQAPCRRYIDALSVSTQSRR